VLVPGGRFVALEMRAGIHSLPTWLQPLPHICAVDMNHDTLDALRRVFGQIEVQRFWLGMLYLAFAEKS
jgi:hypothetical protein